MEHAYAQALWRTVEGGIEPKKAVDSLHVVLSARGRAGLMPRISRAFARLAQRERRRSGLVLTIAREKDATHAKRAARAHLEHSGIENAGEMDVRVDNTIIGGWRLEGNGLLVDESWKEGLLSIYNRVTKDL